MEVNPDQGINVGKNPFYQPSNSSYGTQWQASQGANPVKMGDVPLYSDVVSNKFFIDQAGLMGCDLLSKH